MGRSVSYPSNCSAVCFRTLECETEDDDFPCEFAWQDLIYDIREQCKAAWPSFDDCDIWLDREDNAILSNAHGFVGVSEYCGLVAVWLKPRSSCGTDYPELAAAWCDRIAPKFHKLFDEYRKVAVASNGEAFYEKLPG